MTCFWLRYIWAKTKIEYRKAQGELSCAELQLKKDMGVPAEKDISLQDILTDNAAVTGLTEGLNNGLANRAEIIKAAGFKTIYTSYYEAIKAVYDPEDFQYKEAELLKEKAELNLESIKIDIGNSIRQAYENVKNRLRYAGNCGGYGKAGAGEPGYRRIQI